VNISNSDNLPVPLTDEAQKEQERCLIESRKQAGHYPEVWTRPGLSKL